MRRAASHFGFDANAVYLIATPPNRTWSSSSCSYHSSASNGLSDRIVYIDFPYQPNLCGSAQAFGYAAIDNVPLMLFHEVPEAFTNPRGTGWWSDTWPPGTSGGEIADDCANPPRKVALDVTRTYLIGPLWSDAAGSGGCVFARTKRFDSFYQSGGNLYTKKHSAIEDESSGWSSWTSWGNPGVSLVSDPGSVSWGANRIDVYVRDSNNQLQHAHTSDGGATHVWDNWGAPSGYFFVGNPDVSSWRPGRLDVFAVARMNNLCIFSLFHRSWENGVDSGWQNWGSPVGAIIGSGPAAASWDVNRMDVFVLDAASPPNIWHLYTPDGGTTRYWEAWAGPPGITLTGDPDLAAWGPLRLDLVLRDSNGHLRHNYWNNGARGWDDWGQPAPTRG